MFLWGSPLHHAIVTPTAGPQVELLNSARRSVRVIKAPVLGMYGETDSRITSTVDATIASMKKLGKSYESHIYKGATHAFLQYQHLGENAAATKDSWPRTIAFLKEHLR